MTYIILHNVILIVDSIQNYLNKQSFLLSFQYIYFPKAIDTNGHLQLHKNTYILVNVFINKHIFVLRFALPGTPNHL